MTHCPLALKYKFTMNLKSTLLLLLCLMMAGMVAAKDNTKVIAHRGYWKRRALPRTLSALWNVLAKLVPMARNSTCILQQTMCWLSTTIMISKENISNLVHTMN